MRVISSVVLARLPADESSVAPVQTWSAVCFLSRFCAGEDCAAAEFVPAILRICLAPRARLIFAVMPQSALFAPDRELVRSVAGAISITELRAAIDDYWFYPANRAWWRRRLGLQISTSRLRRVAGDYLPLALPRFPVRRAAS